MRQRPLLQAACIFVIGILSAYYGLIYAGIAGVVLAYAVGRLIQEKRYWRMLARLVLLASLFLGSYFHMRSELSFFQAEQSQIAENDIITLQGEIYKKECKNGQQYYYFKNCYALTQSSHQSYVPCNKVRVSMGDDTYPIGQTLVMNGQVHMFKQATNEGQFDMQWHFRCQQIDFSLDVFCVQFSDGKEAVLREKLYQFRKKVGAVYEEAMTYGAGILSTMLLGDQSSLDTEVKNLYQSAGISHILAISGLHVSMVGLSLYKLLRRRGRSYFRSSVISFALLMLYAIMTGGSVSTSRAVGMVALTLVATVLGQGYDMLNGLGAMVLVLLFENPMLLWYSGFQFSVVALLGIGVFGSAFAMEVDRKPRWWERLGNSLLSSLAVWLSTLPLVAYYYYEVSSYSMLLNLLILPLLKIIFGCGIAGGLLGLWLLGLGRVVLMPCAVFLRLYDWLAQHVLAIPGAKIIVGKPTVLQIIAFYAVLLGLSALLHGRKIRRKRMQRNVPLGEEEGEALREKFVGCLIRVIGVGLLLLILFWPHKKQFEIDVLDVGQGDGVYFCTGEASVFLDGGSSGNRKIGEYTILPFLKSKGVKKVDYWLISHADIDHVRGLEYALEEGYKVGYVVVAKPLIGLAEEGLDENMANLLALAKAHSVPVIGMAAGDAIDFGEDVITCIYPRADDYSEDANDLCLVFTYEHAGDGAGGGFRGMFAGDISYRVEQEIVRRYAGHEEMLDVDYYKVNHHGSRYSSSREWLAALSTEYATISCGAGNSYGHPHSECTSRLQEAGVVYGRTDVEGEIKLTPYKIGFIIKENND